MEEKKILAIDNSKLILTELKALLFEAFPVIKFLSASSISEGLALCHNKLPDIVLLDIAMPGIGDGEVFKKMKSAQLLKSILIVMITTAETESGCRIKALESGADGFLAKPVDKSELTALIRSMLRLKDAEDYKQNEKQRIEELDKQRQRTEELEKELEQHTKAERELQIACDELKQRRKTESTLFEKLKAEVQVNREAAEALYESERSFREIFNSTNEAIFIDDATTGKMIDVNEAMLKMYGFDHKEDVLSGDIGDLSSNEPPYTRANALENIRKAMYEGPQTFDWVAKRKNGECFWVEVSLKKAEIDGKSRVLAVVRDINDRKINEEKKYQSEKLYRTLIETSPDGITMADLNGTIITANNNACRMFGFKNENELKAHCSNYFGFVAPVDNARARENMKQLIQDEDFARKEYIVIRKDGTEFPIEIRTSIIYDNQDLPYAIISVIRDITQRKKTEDTYQFLLNTEWARSDKDFFHSLARYLSKSLGINFVCIHQLLPDNITVKTLAVFSDGNFVDKNTYTLNDITCGEVAGKTICRFDRNVRNLFPHNALLKETEAECFVGVTLWSLEGKPIGFITLLNRQPLEDLSTVESILNLVSIRTAGELERLETEHAFFQSRKAFQNYFENCSVGMSVTSVDKKWLEVNHSLCQMLGYSKEELGKFSWDDLTHPEDIEKNIKLFNLMIDGKTDRYSLDKRFIRKDGSFLYTSLSVVCERNPDDSIHHLLASYVDVTARQQAEETIRQERYLLRTLIDNLPACIYFKDTQCRKIVSNKADLNHMGFTSESEVIDKTDIELFPGAKGERGYQEDLSVIQTGIPLIDNEISSFDANGNQHWRATSKFPLYDENQQIKGLVGIGYDMTDRKLIGEALKASEELYRNLIERMPDGVYKSTHAGKFVSVNPAMVAILGYDSKEDLMAIDITKELYFEEDEHMRLVTNNKEDSFDVYKMKRKDGSEVWVEDNGWYTLDEKGNTLYHEGIIRDITERKSAENKLRILSQAVEQNPASTIITNASGNIEFVNTAFTFLTQYSMEEVINKPPRLFNQGHLSATDFNAMWKALTAGTIWKGEYQNRRKDGSTYWENVKVSSLTNGKGEICNYILITDDITEKKKMLDDLIAAKNLAEESNRLKSAFLATMNHELRTPLNHILGFSELIMAGVAPEDNASFATSIQTSGQSLLSIIEDVFDLALAEQANIKLRNQTFSLMDHFMENKASFDSILRTSAKHEQIRLIFRPDTQWLSSYVTADRSKINQVLTNLFKNAVKFTHKGTIEFGYKIADESNLTFYIKDTGIGIAKEKQDIIFDFFRQVDDSYTRVYGGIGVGLAIAKKITKILQGELTVVSEAGKGSTFSLSIPVELSAIKVDRNENKQLDLFDR